MYMELVSPLPTDTIQAQALPNGWGFLEFVVVLIGDGHIVDGFYVCGFTQLLDGCDKAFRAWVEEMFRDGTVIGFAPFLRLNIFLGCEACAFDETDEPYCNVSTAAKRSHVEGGIYKLAICVLRYH